jgi:hypothetical protein
MNEHPIRLAQAAPITPYSGISIHPERAAATTTKEINIVNLQGLWPACKATYQGIDSNVIAQPANKMSNTSTACE